MKRKIIKISKPIHKFLGLVIILFLMLASISGIVLNHKDLFSPFSVPDLLVPGQYSHKNWNRGSMANFVFDSDRPNLGYIGGKKGIFRTEDGGQSFHSFMNGYPASLLYRKTNHLILHNHNGSKWLLAGNLKGLFIRGVDDNAWRQLSIADKKPKNILKIIKAGNRLLLLSDSALYAGDLGSFPNIKFSNLNISKSETGEMGMIDYVRQLHSGQVWGTPGRLLFDLLGFVIIFLSISAFYIWIYPRKKNKYSLEKREAKRKAYRFWFKYHKRLGIIFGLFLLMVAVSAFFLRPPFIAVIANKKISKSLYPAIGKQNPWEHRMHNALYDEEKQALILETSDGFFSGKISEGYTFKKIKSPVSVFVMGATVFEKQDQGYLIGSFNGLYHINAGEKAIDYMTKKQPRFISSVVPGKFMITGFFRDPSGNPFITTHRKGILKLNGESAADRFPMPDNIANDNRMSLWNYMFEIHNGRIFKDNIGNFYILLVPLGSLFLFLVLVSGIIDWWLLYRSGPKRTEQATE